MVRAVDVPAGVVAAIEREVAGGAPGSGEADVPPTGRVTVGRAGARPDRALPANRDEITGDAGDGWVVGRAGHELIVTGEHGWFAVRRDEEGLTIEAGDGVRPWSLVRDAVRPAVQIAGLDRGVAVVHAAAVVAGGTGLLVAGWSESGKTETALALAERGARFVGDKWTIAFPSPAAVGDLDGPGDGPTARFAPYPVRVGIRDWVVPHLPTLARALGRSRRARLGAGSVADRLGRAIGGIAGAHPASDALLGPVGRVGSLAATIRLQPATIRGAYGQPEGESSEVLRALVVLTTVEPGTRPAIEPLDPAVAAERLARSAAYERRGFHLLGERAAALFGDEPPIPGFGVVAAEAEVLRARFRDVRTFELRMPFPADPGPGADLILSVV